MDPVITTLMAFAFVIIAVWMWIAWEMYKSPKYENDETGDEKQSLVDEIKKLQRRNVSKYGVKFNGKYFWNELIRNEEGKTVLIKPDENRPGQIMLFDERAVYLCNAAGYSSLEIQKISNQHSIKQLHPERI